VTVWKEWTWIAARVQAGWSRACDKGAALGVARGQIFFHFLFRPGNGNAVCKDMPSNYTKSSDYFLKLFI
jgi:hypothetical protein